MIPVIGLTYIDGGIILFALIMLIVGLAKGFAKQIFSLLGTIAVIIGAVLLTPVVSPIVSSVAGEGINGMIAGWITGSNESFGVVPPSAWVTESATKALNEVWASLNLGFFASIINPILLPIVIATGTASIAAAIAPAFGAYLISAIAFIVLLIALGIVLAILKGIFAKATELPVIKQIDKLLGGIVSLALAGLISCGVLALIPLLGAVIPSLGDWYNTQLSDSIVAKFLSEFLANTLMPLLTSMFK